MTDVNRIFIPKATALFSVMIVATLLLTVCTTANAKGEVGSTRYSVQQLQQLVNEAHAKFKNVKDGKNADYIPILATVPSELGNLDPALALRTLPSARSSETARLSCAAFSVSRATRSTV